MRKIDLFESKIDKMFSENSVTKAQLLDAFNKCSLTNDELNVYIGKSFKYGLIAGIILCCIIALFVYLIK